MTRLRFRRCLVVLAALGLLVGACSSGDDDTVDTADDPSTDEGASTDGDGGDAGEGVPATGDADGTVDAGADSGDDPAAPGPDAGSDPAATPAPSDGEQPASPPPSDAGTPAPTDPPAQQAQAPGKSVVPKAGTYTYARTSTSDGSTESSDQEVTVRRLSGNDATGRIELTFPSEQGTLQNEVDISDGGRFTFDLTVIPDSPLGEIRCDWDPNWTFLDVLTEGASWSYDSSCEDTAKGISIEVSGQARVVGFETIQIGGGPVNTWVIESTTTQVIEVTAFGSGTSTTTGRTWFDPQRGISVKSDDTTEAEGDFGSGTTREQTELKAFAAG